MLRIEEIVGAMDDEFRYSLDALSDERLTHLMTDKAALRRLRPVGVSTAEAQAMIADIQKKRAHPPAKAKPVSRPRKPRAKRPAQPAEAPPPAAAEAASPAPEPIPVAEMRPVRLPPPAEPALLSPPVPQGPAIRLGPPEQENPVIELGPPAPAIILPPPAPSQPVEVPKHNGSEARRHAVILALLILASSFFLIQYGG